MTAPPTARQAQVLAFITGQAVPPSFREVGVALGLSKTTAAKHIKALIRRGLVTQGERNGRVGGLRARATPVSSPRDPVPLLGRAGVGKPLAEGDALGRIHVDAFLVGGGDVFAVQQVGDTMESAGILTGDYLFCQRARPPVLGEVVLALVEGNAVALRWYPEAERVRLQPDNLRHRPVYVMRQDFRDEHVLGVVIGVWRHLEARAPTAENTQREG